MDASLNISNVLIYGSILCFKTIHLEKYVSISQFHIILVHLQKIDWVQNLQYWILTGLIDLMVSCRPIFFSEQLIWRRAHYPSVLDSWENAVCNCTFILWRQVSASIQFKYWRMWLMYPCTCFKTVHLEKSYMFGFVLIPLLDSILFPNKSVIKKLKSPFTSINDCSSLSAVYVV